jgi:hypothetical protein
MKPFKMRDLAEEIRAVVRSADRVKPRRRLRLHTVRKTDDDRASQWNSKDLKKPQRNLG